MTLPLPRATLFPYTTLFRSWRSVGSEAHVDAGVVAHQKRVPGAEGSIANPGHQRVVGHDVFRHELARGFEVTLDRKSTRLNSSHVAISYAVFCLKKKNKYAN